MNTVVMYGRLVITTIIGLFTSRFVLQALGTNDFGLYSVVGGLIAMLNVLSTAMTTTTRRFINVEKGNKDGNLNRIFNVSRLLHIGFAFFIIIVAEVVGMFYINNYLNVEAERLPDAVFVFQISTIAAAVGICVVPYQALLEAHEKFTIVAVMDFFRVSLGLGLVLLLLLAENDVLRKYSVGMALITLILSVSYITICSKKYKDVVKFHFYKETQRYKEILYFNNYVALGATSYLSRTQASNMLINYFFGTLVNAAFAIGYTIETYSISFVTNLGTAAAPQITSNYNNNYNRSLTLTATLHRITVYMMLFLVLPLSLEMDMVLHIWLKDVPDGAFLICRLTLLSALARVVFGGTDKLVQASGKIKWFQIIGSIFELLCIPISYVLFQTGYKAYAIIIVYIIYSMVGCIITFLMLKQLLGFDLGSYIKKVYYPIFKVLVLVFGYAYLYQCFSNKTMLSRFWGIAITMIVLLCIILLLGITSDERRLLKCSIKKIINR